jgi:hypothetical protein
MDHPRCICLEGRETKGTEDQESGDGLGKIESPKTGKSGVVPC